MVLLHVKNSDEEQFLFEAPAATPVGALVADLAAVLNLRHRIARLRLEGEELAKHGPAKAPHEAGSIDDDGNDGGDDGDDGDKEAEGERAAPAAASAAGGGSSGNDDHDSNKQQQQLQPRPRAEHYCRDPTGRRSGDACAPELARKLVAELAAAASTALVAARQPLTLPRLQAAVDGVRGAVIIAYPQGLPEWDFVRECLEGREQLEGSDFCGVDLDPAAATLWFAGKALAPDRPLSAYAGRNERTRLTVKLTKKGAGAPAREPAVDAETQQAMLAWYHRRQQQEQALAAAADDAEADGYAAGAPWADGRALKAHFSGVGARVRIPH